VTPWRLIIANGVKKMSVSDITSITNVETSSGLMAEAVGGIATIVLAVLALSGISQEYLLPIAPIVFGAALVIEGTSMATNFVHVLSAGAGEAAEVGINGVSAVLLGGVSGIILGVLALVGIAPGSLASAAIIVFGSAMVLSSAAASSLNSIKLRAFGGGIAGPLGSIGASSAGAQVLAGLAVIVLGILALAGPAGAGGGAANAAGGSTGTVLDLVALIVAGAAILITGNGMNNAVLSAFSAPARGMFQR
jgi:hypothetical protein